MKLNSITGLLRRLDLIFVWPVLLYRHFKFGYTYRRIYLGQGEWTLVDPADYYWLKRYNWFLKGTGTRFYAYACVKVGPGKTKMVSMHREIMKPPRHLLVDHRNRYGLDNRRANLRWATQSQNRQNRTKRKDTSSRFIGVCFDKQTGKWKVRIKTKGKEISLGRYKDEVEAAKAYDAAARKYHKEFACLNFPETPPTGGGANR